MTKRKRYSAEFKARVALDAIREELTLAELSTKHGVHPNMISAWKRAAIVRSLPLGKNMADAFNKRGSQQRQASEAELDSLHAKIGQLVVERDFSPRGTL